MKTDTEIKDLNTKLSLVASDGYVSIRNPFLAVPRRGHFDRKSAADSQAILTENQSSYAGDILADALLFEKSIRNDLLHFRYCTGLPRMW